MFLPNLKHLRYLIALYQEQNFHRAASACFVSQSTLSSAILKLEAQLNCQLIERYSKSFIFTTQCIEVVNKSRQL
jgi:LysR family hydrogen peroxide-inducible transcriptional activator